MAKINATVKVNFPPWADDFMEAAKTATLAGFSESEIDVACRVIATIIASATTVEVDGEAVKDVAFRSVSTKPNG